MISVLHQCQDGHCGPLTVLVNGYRKSFPRGQSGQGGKLAASSSTTVKNVCSNNSISTHAFLSCTGTTATALFAVHKSVYKRDMKYDYSLL